ncbi:MAG: hypothetical protein ABJN62_05030 [Halioglobus sp.]
MKIWLAPLLILPALVFAEDQNSTEIPVVAPVVDDQWIETEEPPINWVDTGQTVAAEQAQAAVEWMDEFFGDPTYDLEKAESFLRLELENDWDQDDGNDFGVRVRGKVQLPKISKRLDLVFSEADGEAVDSDEREDLDNISLQLKVRESERSRFDATMGFSSGHLKPGIRYRNEGDLQSACSYRYVQRVQYEDGENFFTIAQGDLFQAFENTDVLRWSNRIKYGDRTQGMEWRSRLSLFQRYNADTKRPLALNHFLTVSGETQPDSFAKNYRLGTLWRRQVYRDFLFVELEPAINYRRREYEDDRELAWSFVVRLEIALSRDFSRTGKSHRTPEGDSEKE